MCKQQQQQQQSWDDPGRKVTAPVLVPLLLAGLLVPPVALLAVAQAALQQVEPEGWQNGKTAPREPPGSAALPFSVSESDSMTIVATCAGRECWATCR